MIRISQIKIHNNGQLKGYKNGIAEPGMLQKQLKMQAYARAKLPGPNGLQ